MANTNGTPTAFGYSTVATVLRRELAVFEDNARRNRDVANGDLTEDIIAAFDAVVAHTETLIAAARREQMAVAS